MPKEALIIFISIVLLLYGALNFYVYRHTSLVLNSGGWQLGVKYLLLLLIFAYPIGRVLEKSNFFCTHNLLITAGSIWLAVLTYLVLAFILADITFLLMRWLPQFKEFNFTAFYRWWTAAAYLVTVIVVTIGYFNALNPIRNEFNLQINSLSQLKSGYKIVFLSDIHLGAIIGNGRLTGMVERVNAEKADLILLGGDVFDEDLGLVIKNNMGDLLKNLQARLGVYAVTGNHEYIGGASAAVTYLENHGITVLQDTTVNIENKFFLAGRKDYSSARFGSIVRKPLSQILPDSSNLLPVILLDHQPQKLSEAVDAKIALQLSGHTHHGQLWPFGYLTARIFQVSRGLQKIGESYFFVSTGYGTWGPPVRTGNHPEMVVINLEL